MKTHLLLASTALALSTPAPAQPGLVGIAYGGALYRLNPSTGTGTAWGTTGMFGHGGLARIDDTLWTHDLAGRLHRIDIGNGATTAGPMTQPALNSIRAMAVDRYGQLLVIQNGGGSTGSSADQLYAVDPTTGAATLRGSTAPFTAIQGLAFHADGRLFGWDTQAGLVRLDPSNGATTDVNPALGSGVDIQCLAFAPNGVLYGARHTLFAIDLLSGATTAVGSGGFSDLRGLEPVHGPRLYDNGPLVTHPGGGFGGADLSLVQNSLGLSAGGWSADWGRQMHAVDDFATNGPWLVDCIEFFAWRTGSAILDLTAVRLAIYDGDPATGGQVVPGSPLLQTNLCTQPGYLVATTWTNAYRASEQNPLNPLNPIQRIRVQLATPLALNSAALPSGRYWLRWSFSVGTTLGNNFLVVPPVTIRGLTRTGNGQSWFQGTFQPALDGLIRAPQGFPFAFYGVSLAPPAEVTNLGGACGPALASLDIRGATAAGGTVVHELAGPGGFPAIAIGFADPNLPLAPLCGCVRRASFDFVAFGLPRYDLVAPPGVGAGFVYYAQGLQVDVTGTSGLPCDPGAGYDFRLTDGYRVRFW